MRSILVALCLGLLSTAARGEPLTVFSAASLVEVVPAVAAGFQGVELRTSFGASSELARQIADGAPADVFLAASRDWIDFLRDKNLLDGEPVVIARNTLVCVAPRGGALAAAGVSDPKGLAAMLGDDEQIAIGAAGVPAGEYARASLGKLGLLDGLKSRLVGQKDVRAVLHAVETGEVAAGFVYSTDARSEKVATLFAFDPATHPPIELWAAAIRASKQPEAARGFVSHLQGDAARAALRKAGFALP